MPLLEQLKQLSKPGNPGGVCAVSASVTALALMEGPESLTDVTSIKLPVLDQEKPMEINPQLIRDGGVTSAKLDVSKLESGKPDVWKWEKGEGTEMEGGQRMIEWLTDDKTSPGVYVACIDDPQGEDEHFFNIAKTDDGKVYLVDSSMQNFMRLKGAKDLGMSVIGPMKGGQHEESGTRQVLGENEEVDDGFFDDTPTLEEDVKKVGKEIQEDDKRESQTEEVAQRPFSEVYCTGNMKLSFCGALNKDCARELQQSLKRALREDYKPFEKLPVTGQKQTLA